MVNKTVQKNEQSNHPTKIRPIKHVTKNMLSDCCPCFLMSSDCFLFSGHDPFLKKTKKIAVIFLEIGNET